MPAGRPDPVKGVEVERILSCIKTSPRATIQDMAQGHMPDEWIHRSELRAASAMVARLVAIQQPFKTREPR
jgi:hypothetical protein